MQRSYLLIPLLLAPMQALIADSNAQRLNDSAQVLNAIMSAPDKGIPTDLFHKSRCVIVIPSMKKGGFIFSAKYGRGFASCRKPGGTGWTAPAAMRIEGGGFGLQIGGEAVDIVMLVMSEKGMKGLLASKFTLGADASAAAGPVGRDATAQTDATMRADILSWSRAKGAFGGLSLEGGTLRADDDVNHAMYGANGNNADILGGKIPPTSDATVFINALGQYGGTSSRPVD
jgi:lipid-binding SYLF domain-containing protein